MTFSRALRLAAAALALQPASADEGPLLVRVRALHLDSANKDSTGMGLSINNKTFPEVVQLLHRPEHRGRADPDLPPEADDLLQRQRDRLAHAPAAHADAAVPLQPHRHHPPLRRYASGASAGKFMVSPTLASVGLGWRF